MRYVKGDKVRIDARATVTVSSPAATVECGNGRDGDPDRQIIVSLDEDYVIPAGTKFSLYSGRGDIYKRMKRPEGGLY